MTYPERQYKEYSCDICLGKFVTNTPKRGKDGKRRCPDCQKERERFQTRHVPLKGRDNHLRTKYGIGLVTYQQMLKDQNYVCAICFQKQDMPALAVDHNHDTRRVRGLLCMNCNHMLGKVKDSIVILQSAIDYLRKHDETVQ